MTVLKPVTGTYYFKTFRPDHLDSVAGLQCFSCHRFMTKEHFARLMVTEPRSDGFVLTDVVNRVHGFILYRRHSDFAHFIDLVIHPDHRRKGLAGLLVRAMKNRTKDLRGILATVRENDPLSQHFLSQSGFRAYTVLENFFEDCAAYCFIYSEDKNEIEKACRRKHE